jgi:hypothetical protein
MDFRLQDCVAIVTKIIIPHVMPVPDQVRDDGSGIQERTQIENHWIPGQARNDKSQICVDLTDNCDTVSFAGMTGRWN